ncbi:related to aspergillopepsin II precursor [Phialocephala subalpina]|jgi:hypothetical protein|uniref:Related to aspergillopepsin II n=1 Tax=Phialocephala subalpina TaxID=576137 RepID=A0A1L7WBM8_9HELO|nr:related to aspergillopepsin II precursor [Phialocephala subalpina]
MKFVTLASSLLLAGSSMAAPGSAMRKARAAQRSSRKSLPPQRLEAALLKLNNITNVEYDSNWAGSVITTTGVKEVTGTFTVPTPSSEGSGSAWVGIDGDSCQTAILQTGIDWTNSGGDITYDAWYEWYPDYAYDFSSSDISLSAGDSITVTVKATSETGGTAVIENTTTGETVKHTFSGEGSEGDLCEYDAEWIIEDFESGDSLVSFADFGTVEFTGATATTSSGTVEAGDGSILDIEQSSEILTKCSASGTTMTCKYV